MDRRTPSRFGLLLLGVGTLIAAPAVKNLPTCQIDVASAAENEPFGRLSVSDLEAKMQDAKAGKLKLFIYDNNSEERFKKGHVPTARWLDYSKIQASDLPSQKDATLVFYCANEH